VNSSQDNDYADAGFNGKLEPGVRPVLLIIDPVVAYVDPDCPLYAGVEDVAAEIVQLRHEAEKFGIPVVVTKVLHDESGRTGGIYARKVPSLQWLRASSRFSAYIDGLGAENGAVEVVKSYASAFAGTSLAATLTAMACDTVVVTGFSTSGCVRASATDAMQLGFIPFIARQGVGDRLAEVHEANLFDMQAKVGEVVDSAVIIALFEGTKQWRSR